MNLQNRDIMLHLENLILLERYKKTLSIAISQASKQYDDKMNKLKNGYIPVPSKPIKHEVSSKDYFTVFGVMKAKKEEKKRYQGELAEYNNDMANYKKTLKNKDVAIANLPAAYDTLNKKLKAKYNEVLKCLDEYYQHFSINEYYRDLPALCKIYEYFDQGLVNTLQEAYKEYKRDCQYNELMTNINEIWKSIDKIESNQKQMYKTMVQTKQMVGSINGEISNLYNSIGVVNSSINQMAMWQNFDNMMNRFELDSIRDQLR